MQNPIINIPFSQVVPERAIKTSDRSCVYLVRDKSNQNRYIYRSFLGNAQVYHRLLGVNCRHLPKILEVKESEGWVHVLEEYIQGDTLDFLLEGGTLAPAIAKQIIIELCRALKVLHGIGAVHRDIKPENVIIRGSEAVLIDFDASRLFKKESTTDTQIMGTTGYAAPEQYGFSQTDARADIYSLGIVLNEMLTNEHPSRHLAEGKLRPVIEKCTQINADRRYTSVKELTTALNAPMINLPRPLLWAAASVAIVAAVWCGISFLPVKEPAPHLSEPRETAPMATAPQRIPTEITETPTTQSSVPVIQIIGSNTAYLSSEPWSGSTDGYGTTFWWDLDGDGQTETYLFGVDFINSPHENVVYYDRNGYEPGETHVRDVHPKVWRQQADGTLTEADEFAELLTDVSVIVWPVENADPSTLVAQPYNCTWPGCIRFAFSPQQDETWLYRISAQLGEQTLTAAATTIFVSR